MTDSLTSKASPEVQRAAEFFKQWYILDPAGAQSEIRPDRRYLLKNSTNRHFLFNKSQNFGIDLGFSDDASKETEKKVLHWSFHNQSRTPVRYGEPVAIRCKDGYLRYGDREWGINLLWSDSAVYEWRLYGGKPGTAVRTRDPICIFNPNPSTGEPMIYFQREVGGNIGWPSSKTLRQQGLDWAKETVRKAVVEYLKTQAGGGGK
jgi:hypothetical protein